ncbi:hypothetical protein RFI_12535 [Reticulomyxa filosa]|uniref:Uncharacterized protein n=1 Tax=Reticulomyxa filosa TaxID=46433 RepID=X6NFU1_RETFI|nr:hypothetical protein RFI_12535 [Reticulomyxa filosa]|eukprot:ETO24624.1 hypothetical protein RFI_12535 [Reticulomyxa filosa]
MEVRNGGIGKDKHGHLPLIRENSDNCKNHTPRYGWVFCLILYAFIISDLYIRVTPFLVVILLFERVSWIVFLSLCVALSVFECLMLRFVLLKDTVKHKWKDALKYFSIGIISSSYYLLCCIGLKWLPQNIRFRKGLAIEHTIRALLSFALTLLSVFVQTFISSWQFEQATILVFLMLTLNLIVFLIMLCRLK